MVDITRGQLWLLRHGDTDWASTGRHTGRTDIPLNANGEATARARAQDLAGHEFARVICSPLSRARRGLPPVFGPV